MQIQLHIFDKERNNHPLKTTTMNNLRKEMEAYQVSQNFNSRLTMQNIIIPFGRHTFYKVYYEYSAAQKGNSETQNLPESFEPTAIHELLCDDSWSDDLIEDFTSKQLIEVSNIIRNEVKHSY